MFNISQVGKILKATNRLNMPTEFNASLPITIEVKKQINPIRYILKLGKKEVETKSYTPLEIGGKYKAQINQTDNKIEIKNLKKIPNIFNKFPNSIKYGIDDLLKDDPLKSPDKYKTFLMKNLAQANNQQEFVFYSQMLLALNQEVYHLFINDEKKSLIQLKPKKKKLKFYGFFENLGGIGGEIYLIDEIYLDLMVEFHNSLYLIEKHLSDLKGIIINSIKQENLTPLFEISGENILNLKA